MNQSSQDDSQPFRPCPFFEWNPSTSSTIASTAVSGISFPLAILLNLLVIIAVAKKKELRSINNILLASMAFADLLIGSVAQPLFFTAGIFRLQDDDETMCLLIQAGILAMYVQTATIYHLTAVASERYVAVTKSVNYKAIVTKSRMRGCIAVMWVLTALSIIPSAVYQGGLIGKTPWAVVRTCVSLIPLTICLAATVYFYIAVYLKTRRRNEIAINRLNAIQAARETLQKEIAKTAFLLTVALLVLVCPNFCFSFPLESIRHFQQRCLLMGYNLEPIEFLCQSYPVLLQKPPL